MEPHFPLAAQIVAVARESGGPLTPARLEFASPYLGLCNDGPSVASGGQDESGGFCQTSAFCTPGDVSEDLRLVAVATPHLDPVGLVPRL